jgi:hypothetical protein
MTVYPLDFQRRAEQKWARRFHSVRLPVARGGNCVRAPIRLVHLHHREPPVLRPSCPDERRA